ncbi:hypothetical protein OG559_10910 [Micromonospora sp. NBC_01405]
MKTLVALPTRNRACGGTGAWVRRSRTPLVPVQQPSGVVIRTWALVASALGRPAIAARRGLGSRVPSRQPAPPRPSVAVPVPTEPAAPEPGAAAAAPGAVTVSRAPSAVATRTVRRFVIFMPSSLPAGGCRSIRESPPAHPGRRLG